MIGANNTVGERQGFQHDSTSQAMATLWNLGRESTLWDTYFKSDTYLLTKQKLPNNAKNLDYFDAVAFYTTGNFQLTDEQKSALLSFVRDDGKGFIGVHSAPDSFYDWPEYGEMIGGYFDGHPWNTFQAPSLSRTRRTPSCATSRRSSRLWTRSTRRRTSRARSAGCCCAWMRTSWI